jgi:hypothetical protein
MRVAALASDCYPGARKPAVEPGVQVLVSSLALLTTGAHVAR